MDTLGESREEHRCDRGKTGGCSWWLLISKTPPHGFAINLFWEVMMNMDASVQGAGMGN